MSPAPADPSVVRRQVTALRLAVTQLRRHVGSPLEAFDDLDER